MLRRHSIPATRPVAETRKPFEWLVSPDRSDAGNLGRLILAASICGAAAGLLLDVVFPGVGEPIAVTAGLGGPAVGASVLVIDKLTQ